MKLQHLKQPQTYRYTKSFESKSRKSIKYRNIKHVSKDADPEVQEGEAALSEVPAKTLQLDNFNTLLRTRAQLANVLTESYAQNQTAMPLITLFRMLKFLAYINQKKTDQKWLVCYETNFQEPAFIMENWSAPNVRYNEPIRGKGLRKMLQQHRFQVYLTDEFRTSRCCPACLDSNLQTFKQVPNPCAYRRQETPNVTCHGLLR